jgi:hypothetical protein
MVTFLLLVLLCLMLVSVLSIQTTDVNAEGSTLFVSPTGSGTACTQSAPCQPDQGIANAVDYDVVYFKGGTYWGATYPLLTITNSISLFGGWDGAATGDIIVDPDAYPTIIDGESVWALIRVFDTSPVYTISIKGFTFLNGYAESPGAYTTGGAIFVDEGEVLIEDNLFINNFAGDYGGAIYIESPDKVDVIGNTFTDNQAQYGGGGVFVSQGVPENTSVTITGNSFVRGDADYGSAIGTSNSNVTIASNWITDTIGVSAISISSSGEVVTIVNNIIVRPQQSAVDISGSNTLPHQVLNNTIVDSGYGIISYSGTNVNIVNNIISDSWIGGIKTYGGTLTGSHNLLFNNLANPSELNDPLFNDPLFVDPDNDDYHIQDGSPARDAGTSVPLSFDFDYDYRPSGSGYDIGADEIVSGFLIFVPLIVR